VRHQPSAAPSDAQSINFFSSLPFNLSKLCFRIFARPVCSTHRCRRSACSPGTSAWRPRCGTGSPRCPRSPRRRRSSRRCWRRCPATPAPRPHPVAVSDNQPHGEETASEGLWAPPGGLPRGSHITNGGCPQAVCLHVNRSRQCATVQPTLGHKRSAAKFYLRGSHGHCGARLAAGRAWGGRPGPPRPHLQTAAPRSVLYSILFCSDNCAQLASGGPGTAYTDSRTGAVDNMQHGQQAALQQAPALFGASAPGCHLKPRDSTAVPVWHRKCSAYSGFGHGAAMIRFLLVLRRTHQSLYACTGGHRTARVAFSVPWNCSDAAQHAWLAGSTLAATPDSCPICGVKVQLEQRFASGSREDMHVTPVEQSLASHAPAPDVSGPSGMRTAMREL
jgi:hypothetical protein